LTKELRKLLEALNALDGISPRFLKEGCTCRDAGKDGTRKHSIRRKEHIVECSFEGKWYINVCGNHIQNYKGPFYKEIKSIEDLYG
jgi:hypothetical protein